MEIIMKMKILIGAVALTLSGAAFAAEPPSPKKARMPRSQAMKAMTWAI
jgi:hypothetical protein